MIKKTIAAAALALLVGAGGAHAQGYCGAVECNPSTNLEKSWSLCVKDAEAGPSGVPGDNYWHWAPSMKTQCDHVEALRKAHKRAEDERWKEIEEIRHLSDLPTIQRGISDPDGKPLK